MLQEKPTLPSRATFAVGPPKLYAYVHKEVTSAAARLDQFFSRNGVSTDERVTLISDDAGEFDKAVEGTSWLVGAFSIGSTSR